MSIPVILFYAVVVGVLIALGTLLYLRAVASRRRHVCPQCGEQQTVELMEASRCNVCGAPFSSPSN